MLDALILASRLLLAAVFVVAAYGKLADREGTRQAVVAFGVPEPAAPVLAPVLPVAELAVAGLLLPSATALAGALGALALLLLFSGAIALNLARGRAPECHCFGQVHSEPVGPRTLARNGALAAVAALAVAGTIAGNEPSAVAWIGRLDGTQAAVVAIGVFAAVLAVAGVMAFMSLLRAYGRVLVRLERAERALADAGLQIEEPARPPAVGLEPGTAAPAFAVADSRGTEMSLEDLLAPGLPVLLLFASPQCGPCQALLPVVADWQAAQADRLTVAVASEGSPEDVRADAEAHGLDRMLVDHGLELYRAFEASGTPSAVLIDPDGSIASHVAPGPDHIEELAATVIDAPGVPIGAPVPSLELPSLDGGTVRLADLRGRETLLLFWNPDCGFCRGMHGDLLEWEAAGNGNSPQLVLVSSADEDALRSEGFESTVLLDDGGAAGEEFGVSGTPMAVLLGADGRVASRVAAGATAVLALAKPRPNAEVIALPGS
jgi:methylamine dehydrogenase accessory protein MauD